MPCVHGRAPKQLNATLHISSYNGGFGKGHRTSLSKSLRSGILREPTRCLAIRLDIVNSLVVPVLLSVLRIYPGYTDGNGRGENDDALDVAT